MPTLDYASRSGFSTRIFNNVVASLCWVICNNQNVNILNFHKNGCCSYSLEMPW